MENSNRMEIIEIEGREEGYLKEIVTFIWSRSSPLAITIPNFLNKLNVKDLTDLAEWNVSVGPNDVKEFLYLFIMSRCS